jgi:hypothetical protein
MSTIQIPSIEKRHRRTKLNQAGAMTALAVVLAVGFAPVGTVVPAVAQEKKPNIVIIWGDDIGQSNISAYSKGLMGYQTPRSQRGLAVWR